MTEVFDSHTHHRTEDPDTSTQAAERVSTATRHKQALLQAHMDAVRRRNYEGLTAHEAAELAELDDYAGSKRCSDLVTAGHLAWFKGDEGDLIDREGYLCRHNPSGRLARIMVLTPEGIDWLYR